MTLEALERSRLGVGDALPHNRRHHLLDADADVRVRDAALNLLSYRARTRQELGRRLRQKGFHSARIDACLDRLAERGFLDDAAVATAFVRDRLRHRPRGRAMLSTELRGKGVDVEVAARAIDQVFHDENVSDGDLAEATARGWVARQSATTLAALAPGSDRTERDRVRRRLHAYLTRRGFRGDALSRAMTAATTLSAP
ncbi:MAG: regulatory protein RecX [Phycisphaerales bacterium]|nr:regulatory protein RecX [Phycisphaerales bacterium]